MIDKDIERLLEKAALLTNDGYFARHRELVAEYGVQGAWEKVESELPFGLKRFSSFHAFENAKKQEAEGGISPVAVFRK
jgi:hypothetical protein